jgi:hypothetical protein
MATAPRCLSVGPSCQLPTGCTAEGPGCYASCSIHTSSLRGRLANAAIAWLGTPANRTGLAADDVLTWATALTTNTDDQLFGPEPPEDNDTLGPVITWATPAAGQVFTTGTIMIDVTAADPLGVATLGVDHLVGQTRTPIADTDPTPERFVGSAAAHAHARRGHAHPRGPRHRPRHQPLERHPRGLDQPAHRRRHLRRRDQGRARQRARHRPHLHQRRPRRDPRHRHHRPRRQLHQPGRSPRARRATCCSRSAAPAPTPRTRSPRPSSRSPPPRSSASCCRPTPMATRSPASSSAPRRRSPSPTRPTSRAPTRAAPTVAAKWATAVAALERHTGVTGLTTVVPSVPSQIDTLDDADRYGLSCSRSRAPPGRPPRSAAATPAPSARPSTR